VPSPRRVKEWEAFWAAYRAEKAVLAAYHRGELRETVELPLLNLVLHPPGIAAERGSAAGPRR